MTQEQFEALVRYIDARIEEKISDALGRDSLSEWSQMTKCMNTLREVLLDKADD